MSRYSHETLYHVELATRFNGYIIKLHFLSDMYILAES